MKYDIEVGFISKLLQIKDITTIKDSQIKPDFFTGDNRTVYQYIQDTVIKTGEVPSVRAFKQQFPKYQLEYTTIENEKVVGTEENIKFWCEELRKKVKHNFVADSTEKMVGKLQDYDSEEAYKIMKQTIAYIESEVTETHDVDITKDTLSRKEAYLEKKKNKGMQGLPTGFRHLDYITKGLKNSTLTTIIANTGIGKRLSLSTPIPTPSGITTLADIHKGDMIFDEHGKPCKVVLETPVVNTQVYRVHFEDGTFVDCCKDHLWKFKTLDDVVRKKEWRVETTEQILKRPLKRDRSFNLCIPVSGAVQFEHKELPIDPYLLGVLLGDGGFTTDRITFTNTEIDLLERVNNICIQNHNGSFVKHKGTDCQYVFKSDDPHNSNLYRGVKALDLIGKKSCEKFIPQKYLIADVNQRLELLRGMIDTDGSINPKGHIVYYTKSALLKENILYLIRSLGYRCTWSEYERGEKGTDYVIRISTDSNNLFTSLKHQNKWHNRKVPKRKNHYNHLKIVNIEVLDKFEYMKCLKVDSAEHTFICGDFIVTHNTWLEIIIGSYLQLQGYRVLQGVTEMSEEIMRDRYEAMLFSMCYGEPFNYNAFKSGTLNPKTEKLFLEFLEKDLPYLEPLYIVTATGVMALSADIEKYDPDVVLVDSAYLMEDDQGAKDDWLRVTHITRDTKKLAKRCNKPIIINSQADKNTSKKTGPELGSIMYAQSLGQDCLPSDTLILTDEGYREVRNLKDNVFKVFDGENYKKAHCTFAGNKQTVVITYRGNEFSCSPNHKIFVYDEEVKDFVWKKAKDIEPFNDYLLEQNFVGLNGHEHLVRFEVQKGRKEIRIPIEADYEMGMLIGMFIGDGSFKPIEKGQVTISCGHDLDYANYCLELVEKYFDVKGEVRYFKSSSSGIEELLVTWYCVKLGYWFAHFCSDDDFNKTVMNGYSEMNLNFRLGIIAGLLQSDGTCLGQISLVSSDYSVILGTNRILKTLGVCTRYNYSPNKFKGRHKLSLMSWDIDKLDGINLVGYKREQFEAYSHKKNCGALKKPKSYIQKMCGEAIKSVTDYNSPLYKSVALGLQTGELSQKYLNQISIQPYKFMQVEDVVVTEVETPMWDIQVFNNDKRIITNGIVAHNSDDIWTIFRDEVMIQDKEMTLKLLKQREGSLGKIQLNWNFDVMDFSEIYADVTEEDDNSAKDIKDNTLNVMEDE